MASILRAPAGSATAFAARTQTPRGPSPVLIVTSTPRVIGMPASERGEFVFRQFYGSW